MNNQRVEPENVNVNFHGGMNNNNPNSKLPMVTVKEFNAEQEEANKLLEERRKEGMKKVRWNNNFRISMNKQYELYKKRVRNITKIKQSNIFSTNNPDNLNPNKFRQYGELKALENSLDNLKTTLSNATLNNITKKIIKKKIKKGYNYEFSTDAVGPELKESSTREKIRLKTKVMGPAGRIYGNNMYLGGIYGVRGDKEKENYFKFVKAAANKKVRVVRDWKSRASPLGQKYYSRMRIPGSSIIVTIDKLGRMMLV